MTCRRWDVVAVHFPFIAGGEAKKRPALVVSANDLYAAHNVVWAAMITTAKTRVRQGDIPVTDHRAAGLPENCVIRISRLTTLGEAQIFHHIGAITAKDRNAVVALLRRYFP